MIYTKLKEWLSHDLYVEYVNIIKTSPKTKNTEKHHILPRSIFPEFKNDPDNLVELDVIDHLLAHRVLAKTQDHRMILAFFMMFTYEHKRYASLSEEQQQVVLHEKAIARQAMRQVKKVQMKGKYDGEDNPFYGKSHSDKTKKAISNAHKGKKLSADHLAKLVSYHKGRSKPKVECPHCHAMCAQNLATRWHFDNCKLLKQQQGD